MTVRRTPPPGGPRRPSSSSPASPSSKGRKPAAADAFGGARPDVAQRDVDRVDAADTVDAPGGPRRGATSTAAGRAPPLDARRAPSAAVTVVDVPAAAHGLGDVTIVGAGPAGLAQAALLIKRAREVGLGKLTLVERRPDYTRPVGLFLKQITLDALRWLDDDAWQTLAGRTGRLDAYSEPDAARYAERVASGELVADLAHDMLSAKPAALVTIKELEATLRDAVVRAADAHGVDLDLRLGWDAVVHADDGDDVVKVTLQQVAAQDKDGARVFAAVGDPVALPPQGLVLLTEGAAATLRGGIPDVTARATAPKERSFGVALQGDVPPGGGDTWSKVAWADYVLDDGAVEKIKVVRGVNGTNGVHWTVVGIPDQVTFDASDADAYARDVDAYVKKWAAAAGPVDLPITFGPVLARVDGSLVDRAVPCANLVMCGDVVGTSHFGAAGGTATAVTTHVAAMQRFLDDVAVGAPRGAALSRLDGDLRAATLTWSLFGLKIFRGDPFELRARFLPKAFLEELLPPRIVERYWPADGGAPTDPQSPWATWFARAAKPATDTGAALATLDAALASARATAFVAPTYADVLAAAETRMDASPPS